MFLVHDRLEGLVDGVKDPLNESTLGGGLGGGLLPLFLLGVVEVVSPQVLHHFVEVDAHLLGIHLSELFEGEGPTVESGSESDRSLSGGHVEATHGAVLVGASVGGDNNVNVLDNTGEGLVEFFGVQLEFEESAVHLVHEKDRLYTLGNSLPEDGLGLDAHARHTVDNDQSSVSNTEGGGDLPFRFLKN